MKLLVMLSIILLFGCGESKDTKRQDQLKSYFYGALAAEPLTVSKGGWLKVEGPKLLTQNGEQIQLRGMSSHGIAWYPQYYNVNVLRWLRDDWRSDVFRIAMYTEGGGGYMSNKEGNKAKVKEMIDAAIALDMYVIVDWHILSDGNPLQHVWDAKDFFKWVVDNYGDKPNVIYELCNEPNGGGGSWGNIKNYAYQVIPIIRAKSQGIIVVGTPTWDQEIMAAANDPIKGDNLMYAAHFYAGSHGGWLRGKISEAMGKGIAVFVTEWGTSQASGSGGVYFQESDAWMKFLDENKISWANWSLTNKNETSAALNSWASTSGGWDEGALSASGKYVRGKLRGHYNQ